MLFFLPSVLFSLLSPSSHPRILVTRSLDGFAPLPLSLQLLNEPVLKFMLEGEGAAEGRLEDAEETIAAAASEGDDDTAASDPLFAQFAFAGGE